MDKMITPAEIGAAFYVLWGLLHFKAAFDVYKLAQSVPAAMEQGRLMQTAFYIAAFAIASIVLAITLNWRNDRLGFWANGIMVSVADIPFILFVLMPGYARWWPGLLGPILWALALIFTAIGRWAPVPSTAARQTEWFGRERRL